MLLSFLLVLVPALAVAQPGKTSDVERMATDDCARARKAGKTCVLSIEADIVEGSAPTAGETGILGLGFGTAQSLIRLRHDFIREILRSAEDLD